MPLPFRKPILYLITRGASKPSTTSKSPEFEAILKQIASAISAGVDLLQIREKDLSARVLFELVEHAAALTQGTSTRLLVNDRADIAAGAGADGVHLTTQSMGAATIRRTFGESFLIGVSTHSLEEALTARTEGADFVVLGPVFETPSKKHYGRPVGLDELSQVTMALEDFPVLALGGITTSNARDCLATGASGIAGISLFGDPDRVASVVEIVKGRVSK